MFEFETGCLYDLDKLIRAHYQLSEMVFFQVPGNSITASRIEKIGTNRMQIWTENGHRYSAESFCQCTPQKIFYNAHFEKDGKKVNIRAIKNSYDRMATEFNNEGRSEEE